jgi:peptidoglycan/xylan/chitin deacetylase (PgdA/CDA1 family)
MEDDVMTDDTKRIALTFDDGPSGTESTESILALLDKYGVKATFFVVGTMIQANPDKVTAAYDAGHLIENHSRTHPEFSKLSADEMAAEIDSVTTQIRDLGIPDPDYFRPPYGDGDGATLSTILDERGLTPVYWTIDSRDWEIPDAETVHQNVLRDLRNAWGAGRLTNIILFHDIQPHTPDVIDALIPDLQDEGCEFVQVDAIA